MSCKGLKENPFPNVLLNRLSKMAASKNGFIGNSSVGLAVLLNPEFLFGLQTYTVYKGFTIKPPKRRLNPRSAKSRRARTTVPQRSTKRGNLFDDQKNGQVLSSL